jgi:hypothetical protein
MLGMLKRHKGVSVWNKGRLLCDRRKRKTEVCKKQLKGMGYRKIECPSQQIPQDSILWNNRLREEARQPAMTACP